MEVISLILSSLALLVAVVNLFLFFWEKKRQGKRHETLLKYIDASIDLRFGALDERVMGKVNDRLANYDNTLKGRDKAIEKRFSDLENGICPDYNAALAAKESVDRFSEGVMNILTYGNPAPQKEKKKNDEEDKE